jgi:hypothetical protein
LPETVTEAIEWGADFFLAHHPLYLFELAEPEPGEEPTPVAPWKRELENTLNSAGLNTISVK